MTRRTTRRRGFPLWAPQMATLQLLDQVRAIITEYAEYLPLTVRQIFYRLVGLSRLSKRSTLWCLIRQPRTMVAASDAA
jgi:hypothetical protein